MSAKDGRSYADILKEIKVKVDPRKAGLEVLSIRRTRKEEVLLVLKKGGDVRPGGRGKGANFSPGLDEVPRN